MSEYGDSLKRRRKAKGLSQLEVADAVGVSQRAYSLWEDGKRNPKMASIKLLEEVLGPEHKRTEVLPEGSSDDKLLQKLQLGDIDVTVADYIKLQEAFIKNLLQEKDANSKKIEFYADEVMTNMRVDHDRIMAALDRIEGNEPGTIAKEADSISTGVPQVISGSYSRKTSLGKKGKT